MHRQALNIMLGLALSISASQSYADAVEEYQSVTTQYANAHAPADPDAVIGGYMGQCYTYLESEPQYISKFLNSLYWGYFSNLSRQNFLLPTMTTQFYAGTLNPGEPQTWSKISSLISAGEDDIGNRTMHDYQVSGVIDNAYATTANYLGGIEPWCGPRTFCNPPVARFTRPGLPPEYAHPAIVLTSSFRQISDGTLVSKTNIVRGNHRRVTYCKWDYKVADRADVPEYYSKAR